MKTDKKFGYIRETREMAEKAAKSSPETIFTPLEDYLKVIFPGRTWIHDKQFGKHDGKTFRIRPDFLCESEKLIIEYDGLQHYTSPINIRKDCANQALYESFGYKVVRIPYFVQFTKDTVKTLFGVELPHDLASPSLPSMSVKWRNTPAFCCPAGVEKMAQEFHQHPQQYEVNARQLAEDNDEELSGLSLLMKKMADINTQNQ